MFYSLILSVKHFTMSFFSYLAFLDLKKAYDSVPIYNVLMKIHHLGIRGKCYNFIENLYLPSKACVRVDGQLSESFNIKKGVRQGCPLSLTNFV